MSNPLNLWEMAGELDTDTLYSGLVFKKLHLEYFIIFFFNFLVFFSFCLCMCSPGALCLRSLPEYRTDRSSRAVPTEDRNGWADLGTKTFDLGCWLAWAVLCLGSSRLWISRGRTKSSSTKAMEHTFDNGKVFNWQAWDTRK